MTNEEIARIFFAECEEALAAAEAGLEACRAAAHDGETLNAIFRAVHSIKGGAGAFGFEGLQAFAHGFETLLSEVRDGTLAITPALVGLMLRALDLLGDHVASARDDTPLPRDAALLAELDAALPGQETAAAPAPAPIPAPAPVPDDGFDIDALLGELGGASPDPTPWTVRVSPHAGALRNGGEPVLLLRELAGLGGVCRSLDASAVPPLDAFSPDAAYLSWVFELPGTVARDAIAEVFDFVGDDCTVAIAQEQPDLAPAPVSAPPLAAPVPANDAAPTDESVAPAVAAASGASIRIDLSRLDRLIDSVGELVIAQAMAAQRLTNAGLATVEELSMLDGLTREIQELAMGLRAQPIRTVFNRVPRMLRQLEEETGKPVRLEVWGEATELDKTVVERLGEPLTHLIRNAVDHGIEPPDARVAAGKPRQGTIRLSAEQRSGRVLITVADDGAGLDRARVRAKAVERGLVAADAVLTQEEIDNLIFAPGFSTAAEVSNISGRGVGMDVVRQAVKDLGGRITIQSEPGRGSTFTLALPLTLAISDGMIVNVGDQTLVLPLAHVVECLRPTRDEIAGLGSTRQMLNVRGRFIPILPLEAEIGARGAVADPTQAVLIVADTELHGQAALQVDAICDQRQFVIKSLDAHYHPVPGIAGATILGDGRVALIADVDALVAEAVGRPEQRQAA